MGESLHTRRLLRADPNPKGRGPLLPFAGREMPAVLWMTWRLLVFGELGQKLRGCSLIRRSVPTEECHFLRGSVGCQLEGSLRKPRRLTERRQRIVMMNVGELNPPHTRLQHQTDGLCAALAGNQDSRGVGSLVAVSPFSLGCCPLCGEREEGRKGKECEERKKEKEKNCMISLVCGI